MRAILVLMSIANVALAAMSGYFAASAPGIFDLGGAMASSPVSFALVVAFPVFCLIAAAWPHLLLSLGRAGKARLVAIAPTIVLLGVYAWYRMQGLA